MNPRDGLYDEVIAAAFQRRADRGDMGDLRQRILATTATSPQRRPWRLRWTGRAAGGPVRLAWIAAVAGMSLLALLSLLLLVGGRVERSSSLPVEFRWSALGGDDQMYFANSNGGPVAVDPTGMVWVADTGHDRFAIFDPNGTFTSYWGTPGTGDGQLRLRGAGGANGGYGAVAFAPDGTFFVLDVGNLRVQHFAADRSYLGSWGGPGADVGRYRDPIGVAVDARGVVHVLDRLRGVVESYDSGGHVVGSFSPGLAATGTAIAVDGQGSIYVGVCCTTPNAVLEFDTDGRSIASFPSPAQSSQDRPASLAIDADGRLFVTHGPVLRGDKVEVFAPDGAILATFGGPGYGDGQFGYGFPSIALDGLGNAYVTDGALNRLEKFRLRPPLTP